MYSTREKALAAWRAYRRANRATFTARMRAYRADPKRGDQCRANSRAAYLRDKEALSDRYVADTLKCPRAIIPNALFDTQRVLIRLRRSLKEKS